MADFDLNIWIGGLCMLVPDGDLLHVLLPETAGGHGHNPLIGHDFDAPANTQVYPLVPLLDLSNAGVTPPRQATLPGGVLNLSEVTQQGVPRTILTTPAPGLVRSHVVLPRGSALGYGPGGEWAIDYIGGTHHVACMATDLVWTVEMLGTSFDLGRYVPTAPALLPKPSAYTGRPTVEIRVLHIPLLGYPANDPVPGEPAGHCVHYYPLLNGGPYPAPPIPEYVGPCLIRNDKALAWVDQPGVLYSNPRCILTQATVA